MKNAMVNQEKEARKKALEVVFSQIDKQFGAGSVMLYGQKKKQNIDVISTGSLLVDGALGVGGLPRGRVVEIFGPEASGKTTLTLQVLAEAQKSGGTCAFIDAEHAMDPKYATALGVNINDLIISQPDYGEQALDITEMLLRSGAVDVIVVDSVAALVPKAELEGDMGDTHVGLQARLMSQAMRKLTSLVYKTGSILIFINQIRSKIGGLPFASNETTTGGNALKFYSSVRIDLRRIATLKKADKPIGNKVAIKIVKNKVAPPFVRVEVDLIFGKGISKELDLLEMALKAGVCRQSGAWFFFGEEKLAQGRDNCVAKLSDGELFNKIYKAVQERLEKEGN